MNFQIYQYEKLIDPGQPCYLERDCFRLYVEQNADASKKILAVYASASDVPGLNQHLIKNGVGECWMYSCNMNSMARSHPFDLLLLRYDKARSLDTPEAICQHKASKGGYAASLARANSACTSGSSAVCIRCPSTGEDASH